MRESNKIVAQVHELMRKHAKIGVSTLELDMIAEDFILSKGGKPAFKGYDPDGTNPFPGTICSSLNDVVVHGIPDGTKLQDGDLLSVDVGVEKNGYYGDAALSIAIGEISAEKKKLMEVTEKSLYLGIEQAIAGNRVHDISNAVQSFVEVNGFSVVRALCGHGVGRHLHEDPSVPNYGRAGTGPKLKNGMTIAIEPMVNSGVFDVYVERDGWTVRTKDGKPSAHFEHTIVINNDTPEILSVI